MQCNHCGAMLPAGAPICPYCANPTPYNVGSSPSNAYPPPPPPNYGQQPYAPPPYAPPPQIPYGQPVMVPVAPRPRKNSGCGGLVIVVLVIIIIVIAGKALSSGGSSLGGPDANATATSISDNATATADTVALTPTPYPPYTESNPPSGANFSEAAQQVISSAQLADGVDSSYRPTGLQSTFQSNQTIYIVYQWKQGYDGYIQIRWYFNGETKDITTSKYIDQSAAGYGYMTDSFSSYGNTGQGTVEVFWCQDANCTQGGLAWVRPFSVSGN